MKNDISGQVFAGVKVIADVGKRGNSGVILWKCLCLACGNTEIYARKHDLNRGDYQSCGCLKSQKISESNTEHGMSKTTEYKIWDGIIQRCTNPNATGYIDYGGRGIAICDRWLDFNNFFEDMGNRPSKKMSIDRIDNDGNYCKENCRWATKSEQSYNRSKIKNCSSIYKNVYWNTKMGKWIARVLIDGRRVYLGAFTLETDAAKAVEDATNS